MASLECPSCGGDKDIRGRSRRCQSCHARSVQPIATRAAGKANVLPSEVRAMLPVEAAWVGALVEGEGSLSTKQIVVVSTEVETLSTILRFVGGGGVYLHQNGTGHLGNKTVWAWHLFRQASVRSLLQQISPWLTGKQERAQKMLEAA